MPVRSLITLSIPSRFRSNMAQTGLTKLGKLFFALILLLYGASVTSQSGLLLLLIGLIVGCFAVNWSFARRNVGNVTITAPKEEYLVENSNSTQPWKVANPY